MLPAMQLLDQLPVADASGLFPEVSVDAPQITGDYDLDDEDLFDDDDDLEDDEDEDDDFDEDDEDDEDEDGDDDRSYED